MKKRFIVPEMSVYLFITETLTETSSAATNVDAARSAMQTNNSNVTEKKASDLLFK